MCTDDGVKDRVRIAMAALERDTCIRFKEQKGDGGGSWLHFTNPGKQRHCAHDPSYQENGEIVRQFLLTRLSLLETKETQIK